MSLVALLLTRYGAGPLITAAAEALAALIKTQSKLKHPIGRTLAKLGSKPLDTYLSDPHHSFTAVMSLISALPRMPFFERWLVGS